MNLNDSKIVHGDAMRSFHENLVASALKDYGIGGDDVERGAMG